MSHKLVDKIYDTFRNEKSMELFGKPEYQLEYAEVTKLEEYIYDILHPVWKRIVIDNHYIDYEISNTGDVKNMITGTIRKATKVWSGYKKINIYEDKVCHTIIIHRLVAENFVDNPECLPVVNHKNGNKSCNWYQNLEWCTYQENTQHAINTGLSHVKGVTNPNNKYSEEQIHEVCKLLESGKEGTEISKLTGIPSAVAEKIKGGKQWQHIASQYNIPKPNNPERPKELKERITNIILSGERSDKEIVRLVGLPDTKQERLYIGLFKRRLLRRIAQEHTT